jgi:threonine dehydratase
LLPPSKATVAVISGGNIDPELLERVQREAVPSR